MGPTGRDPGQTCSWVSPASTWPLARAVDIFHAQRLSNPLDPNPVLQHSLNQSFPGPSSQESLVTIQLPWVA